VRSVVFCRQHILGNESLEFYHFTGLNELENATLNLLLKLTETEKRKPNFIHMKFF